MGQENDPHPLLLHRELFSIMVSCQPTGQTACCWLLRAPQRNGVTKAKWHTASPINIIPRLLAPWPPWWDLLVPFTTPLPWGAFPLFDFTDPCPGSSPQPHRCVGSSLTLYHLTSHLPGGSSTKCKPSLNGTFPSHLHLQLFCQITQRKPVGQNAMAAICRRGILI